MRHHHAAACKATLRSYLKKVFCSADLVAKKFQISKFFFLIFQILSWRPQNFPNGFCIISWPKLAGNIMLGAEKLWGELLFLEEKQLFFSIKGRKKSFTRTCFPGISWVMQIYVPSGWKHYARGRKTLEQTFVS